MLSEARRLTCHTKHDTGDATFSFYQTVAISQVSPTSVPHTGKSEITCTGINFQPMTSKHGVKCRFTDMGSSNSASGLGGSVYYTAGNMSAEGKAVCATPAIAVTFGTWEHSLALSFNFEGNPAPQWSQGAQMYIYASPIVNRTVPRLISGIGGTTVTLIGTNFKDTASSACWFGSGQQKVSVLAKVVSPVQMQCVMPATPDKSPKVPMCVSINGVDCSDTFNITIYAVKQLFPTAVPQSGGFVNVSLNAPHQPGEMTILKVSQCQGKSCVRCRFRATDGWIEYGAVSAVLGDVIVCSVPVLKLGSQQLELSLNGGALGDWFTGSSLQMYEVPSVTSTFPCTGPVSGGSVVTLRGQNFYKSESLISLCSFGGIRSVATLSDCARAQSGLVLCTTAVCSSAASNTTARMERLTQPESSAGQGAYNVTLSLVLNSVQPNAVTTFLYYKVPAMLSLTPSFCPNTGSSLVTINGRDITGGYNGSRFCRFMPAQPSNHEMLFLDPQNTATPQVPPQPMVTAAYYTKQGTQLVCPCPNNNRVKQQHVRLVVSLNGQQYDGQGLAAAVGAPVTLHATTPLSGDVQGSSIVYATGANFMQGEGLQMIFGTQSVPATVVREGVIKAYSPVSVDMVLGKVSIWVSNGGSDRSTTSTIFEYFSSGLGCPVEKQTQKTCHWAGLDYGACVANECQCSTGYWGRACSLVPQTASVFPLSGLPGGGTMVSVRGLFLGGECCSLDSQHASVPFPVNPQPASQLKVRTSNLVLGATYESFNDALQFSAPYYPDGSVINLEVSFDGGARFIAATDSFRYEQGPVVTDFNPTTSPLGGDTVITIRGSRFWDNVALSCKFGSAGETRALWMSTSLILCASSPYFVRPAATPTDFNSDDNADVKTCAGYNSVSVSALPSHAPPACLPIVLFLCLCVPRVPAVMCMLVCAHVNVYQTPPDWLTWHGVVLVVRRLHVSTWAGHAVCGIRPAAHQSTHTETSQQVRRS